MVGYVADIESETENNNFFRKVLFTASHSQLVVMSLAPGEEIGLETHENVDQFLRIEKGSAKAVLNGEEVMVGEGFAVVVPAGTAHNFVNVSATEKLKLYTVYSPAEHRDGTVHRTKEDALADEEDRP